MGKELVLNAVPASPAPSVENATSRCPPCRSVGSLFSCRCMLALLVGLAVLLSAVFWLPPFFRRGSGRGGPDLYVRYGVDVVASFNLQKPITVLNANVVKLQYDIFDEIGVPNTTVAVINMESLGINSTIVVFGMWPYPKNSNISTGLSILKSSFVSLVLRQSSLHLTEPLFGSSHFFQILKFPGGVTVVPPQNAFLLQKEHMIFNFSLNYPIFQVQGKIDELKNQMKLGLHLKSYEILYVRLTNINGSTVAPPTVVETSIVFVVGNNLPSAPRLKQLAQNIRNSSAGNLGLNHTTFGRVKQIRLSSFLLNTGASSSFSPSPTPQPSVNPRHHHYSSHHHRHYSDVRSAPSPAPALGPALSPLFTHVAPPRFSRNPKREDQFVPVPAPTIFSHSSASPSIEVAPMPSPLLLPKSHKPYIIFSSAIPPSEGARDVKPQNSVPYVSPLPSSSFASGIKRSHLISASSLLYLLWLWK